MTRNRSIVLALLLASVLLLSASGCKKSPAEITSAWPFAEKERTAPKPAAPLIFPYSGKKAPNAAAITKRPLSVKIENSPAARPQTGLNSADVVYETISEGGITRFNCIFHSTIPKVIGPVRSARLSDLWIVPQYNALFFFSGASTSVNAKVRSAKLPNLSEDAGVSAPYSRSSRRPAPHNLYMDTSKAYPTAKDRGYAVTAKLTPLQYDKRRRTDSTATVVTEVTIPFSQANTARWTYDADSNLWSRFTNGREHADEGQGKQVTADNVVVLWAKYDAISRDKAGSTTYDIILGGKGRVSVFRDGRRFDGEWTATKNSPPRFTDASGRPIRLTQGRTWMQVVPLDVSITMK